MNLKQKKQICSSVLKLAKCLLYKMFLHNLINLNITQQLMSDPTER